METLSYKCSAACGDIIYTLPSVKHLYETTGKKGVYYIDNKTYRGRQSVDTYKALKRLLESQDYIHEVLPWNRESFDYDFDGFRRAKYINTPMPVVMANAIGLKGVDYMSAWLNAEGCFYSNNNIAFNITNRYKGHKVNWKQIVDDYSFDKDNNLVFIGLKSEFQALSFKSKLSHYQCNDLYEVWSFLNRCKAVYCNQSSILTIAQATNHPSIFLANAHGFNNVLLGKETIL